VQDLKKGRQFSGFKINPVIDELEDESRRNRWYMKKKIPFRMSTNTDPFCELADQAGVTERALQWLDRHSHPVLVVTKCTMVAKPKYLKILQDMSKRNLCAVSMTYVTINEEIRRILEPQASGAKEKAESISILVNSGIRVAVRLQPLIPGLTDSYEHMSAIVKEAKEAGATHVTAEYLKLEHFIWQRMGPIIASLNLTNLFRELYEIPNYNPTFRKVVYWRVNPQYKYKILTQLAEICRHYGIDFATCKEGLFDLHTTDDCCGAQLDNRVMPTVSEIYDFLKGNEQATWNDILTMHKNTPYLRDLQMFWRDGTIAKKVPFLKMERNSKGIVYVRR
jgi:DNA repair photolyase